MLFLMLLACPGTTPETCAALSPTECAEDAACAVIDGRLLTWLDADTCYTLDPAEPQGCMDADLGCDDAITYADPGDGSCHQFNDGCIPEGWVACDTDPNEAAECE